MSKLKSAFKLVLLYIAKTLFIFALTGGIYLLIESFFRGYTFLEMYYLAGVIGVIATILCRFFTYNMDHILKTLIMTVIGTAFEGLCGILYNYDFHIWDYRALPGTFFYGQCNVIFVVAWFLIFFILIPLIDYIDWKVFHYKEDTPPYYMIFGKKVFQFKK